MDDGHVMAEALNCISLSSLLGDVSIAISTLKCIQLCDIIDA